MTGWDGFGKRLELRAALGAATVAGIEHQVRAARLPLDSRELEDALRSALEQLAEARAKLGEKAEKHCETCVCGRRAPVQETVWARMAPEYAKAWKYADKPAGTVAWAEHLEAMAHYMGRYGKDQDAERMAQRGGLSYYEITEYLGHEPKTWAPRR